MILRFQKLTVYILFKYCDELILPLLSSVKELSKLFLSNLIMMHLMRFWKHPENEPVDLEAIHTRTYSTRQESEEIYTTSGISHGTEKDTKFTLRSETGASIRLFDHKGSGQSNTTTWDFQIY
jgi:hypothetical protein